MFLSEKIFPNQILVEFDELNKINELAINRFEEVHQLLLSNNYDLIKTNNNFPNFLYRRRTNAIDYLNWSLVSHIEISKKFWNLISDFNYRWVNQ